MARGAESERNARSPDEVDIAYLPRNIAPEVLSIQVLPTNVGLASTPAAQVDPNIALSGLEPSVFGLATATAVPRKVYQRGRLRCNGQPKIETATSSYMMSSTNRSATLSGDCCGKTSTTTSSRSTVNRWPTDDTSLGLSQRIRRRIRSGPLFLANASPTPIDIDNTPPIVTPGQPVVNGDIGRVTFAVSDKASYLTRAEYSVNGGDWQPVYADDGISDSPDERYTVEIPIKTSRRERGHDEGI